MRVGDVMTRRVRSCRPTQSVESVMQTLWENDLGALPVVNDNGEPVAMITDRDIAVAAYTQGRPLSQITVASAMSRSVHTAHVNDSLEAAERKMRSAQLRRLPVVDESTRLIGVVTLGDVALLESTSPQAARSNVGQTLAAIARPRRKASLEPAPAVAPVVGKDATEPQAEPPPAVGRVQPASDVRELVAPSTKPKSARTRKR